MVMAKFKLVVSDPDTGKSSSYDVEGSQAQSLIGKKVGEVVDGAIVKMPGSRIQVTGGSSKDGTPIRPSVHGGVRASIVLGGGVGFHPKKSGERRRKMVHGNTITEDIFQINLKVVEKPKKKPKKSRKPAKKGKSNNK
jgi:small subunit ribosomal protein S6e